MASRDVRADRGPDAPHVTNKSANVHIHGITLRNITATGWKSSKGGNDGSAGWFNCADKVPCTDLTLESVHIFRDAAGKTPAPAFRCDHAFGTAVDTTPSAACLQKLKLDDDGTQGRSASAGGLQFLAPFGGCLCALHSVVDSNASLQDIHAED